MSAATRFCALPFAYNGRASLALVPPACFILTVSGPPGRVLACAGGLLAYCFDLARAPEATLVCIWATLGAVYVCLTFADVRLSAHAHGLPAAIAHAALVCLLGQTLFLLGTWATLQFKFLQLRAPRVVLAAERALFAGAPLNAGAVAAVWALGAGQERELSATPLALSAYLLLLYFTLSTPLVSSFYSRDVAATTRAPAHRPTAAQQHREAVVLEPSDASLHAASCVALPVGMYVCLHRRVFTALPWTGDVWRDDVSSLALLLATPQLAMCAFHRSALWWALPASSHAEFELPPCTAVFSLSALACALGFSGRVLLHGFRPFLAVQSPFDVLLVTLACVCVAAVAIIARAWGGPASAVADSGGAARLMESAASAAALMAAIAVGVPLWMLPAPMVAAAVSVHLWAALHARVQERNGGGPAARSTMVVGLMHYAIASVGGLATCGWFLNTHFMRLETPMGDTGVRMATLCVAVLVAAAVAAAIPGLLLFSTPVRGSGVGGLTPTASAMPTLGQSQRRASRATGSLVSICVVIHAVLMTWLESLMTFEDAQSGGTSGVYPVWLLSLTTATGIVLPLWLRSLRIIQPWAAGTAAWLAASRLILLALPSAGAAGVARTAHFLAASIAPLLLPARGGAPMGSVRAMCHVAVWLFTLFWARFLLFDLLFVVTQRTPSDALLTATACFLGGCFLAVLAPRCGRGALGHVARMAAVATLLAALLVVALRPPMPWKGNIGFWYDATHVPDPEPDDAAMYGASARSRQTAADCAPAWALILASSAAAAGSAVMPGAGMPSAGGTAPPAWGIVPQHKRQGSAQLSFLRPALAGAALGWYVATEFLPHATDGSDDITLAACCVAACAACGLLLSQVTSGRMTSGFGSWALLLIQSAAPPLALAHLHGAAINAALHGLEPPRLTANDIAGLRDATATLFALSAALNTAVAFAVRVRSGSTASRAKHPQHAADANISSVFTPFAAPQYGATHAPVRTAPMAASVGDACAMAAFALSCALNEAVSDHPEASLLLCAPLLLLLSPPAVSQPRAVGGAAPQYAALARVLWAVLSLKAAIVITTTAVRHASPYGGAPTVAWHALRDALCLVVTAPAWLAAVRFLRGPPPLGGFAGGSAHVMSALLAAPAQILAAVLTDVPAVRVLAIGALALALMQHSAITRRRAATARML